MVLLVLPKRVGSLARSVPHQRGNQSGRCLLPGDPTDVLGSGQLPLDCLCERRGDRRCVCSCNQLPPVVGHVQNGIRPESLRQITRLRERVVRQTSEVYLCRDLAARHTVKSLKLSNKSPAHRSQCSSPICGIIWRHASCHQTAGKRLAFSPTSSQKHELTPDEQRNRFLRI